MPSTPRSGWEVRLIPAQTACQSALKYCWLCAVAKERSILVPLPRRTSGCSTLSAWINPAQVLH